MAAEGVKPQDGAKSKDRTRAEAATKAKVAAPRLPNVSLVESAEEVADICGYEDQERTGHRHETAC